MEKDETGQMETGVQDDDFEPTAEMMVNDFDDERTLDEEEAMEEAGGEQDEICDLEREKDMPLEELLSMYGYNENENENENEEEAEEGGEEEDAEDTPDDETDLKTSKEVIEDKSQEAEVESEKKPQIVDDVTKEESEKPSRSLLHELYKDDDPNVAGGSRQLRSGSRQASEDEEEEDDGDYSPEEDDWKKTIMVGSDYQAIIPDGLRKYGDDMPYENEDKLLWDPSGISDVNLSKYLNSIHEIHNSTIVEGVNAIPVGSHVRDDEQALYLLQQCAHNVEEATRRQRINVATSVDTMSLWSEEECRHFEAGLRHYGKDFNMIQQNKVRTRSVSELVQFYYLWKKTERHDVFANKSRLEKKKYTLHPGTTDFMERFLDEQDSPVSSPNVHSLLLSSDPKRQARTPPPVQSQHETELITADEARIINTHFEDIARHLDKESLESLVKLAAAARIPNGIPTTTTNEMVAVNRNSCMTTCDTISHSPAHSFAQ